MTTEAQNAGNAQNAQKSTGPTSEGGKRNSSRNAMKDGLSSRSLILPEAEAGRAEERKRGLIKSLLKGEARDDAYCDLLVTRIAVESVRLETCRQEDTLVRERATVQTRETWESERFLAVTELAKGLEEDPEVVKTKLEMSLAGVDWMTLRWAVLLRILTELGTWTAEEVGMARCLLGTPKWLNSAIKIVGDSFEERQTLAKDQIARLRGLRGSRIRLDEVDRDLAEIGLSDAVEKRLKNVRRYENAARRALYRTIDELKTHCRAIVATRTAAKPCDSPSDRETPRDETNPIDDREPIPTWEEIKEMFEKEFGLDDVPEPRAAATPNAPTQAAPTAPKPTQPTAPKPAEETSTARIRIVPMAPDETKPIRKQERLTQGAKKRQNRRERRAREALLARS